MMSLLCLIIIIKGYRSGPDSGQEQSNVERSQSNYKEHRRAADLIRNDTFACIGGDYSAPGCEGVKHYGAAGASAAAVDDDGDKTLRHRPTRVPENAAAAAGLDLIDDIQPFHQSDPLVCYQEISAAANKKRTNYQQTPPGQL